MRYDIRAGFAALALALAACQGGGFDSGAGGMPGEMGPPVGGQPGAMGTPPGEMQGPTIGPNGQPELTVPGATLAPNEAQYPVGDGPTGMKCPQVVLQMQQFNCSLSFNLPPPSPTPSPDGSSNPSKFTPKPKPTPTPSPEASSSADESDDSGDSSASPSPTPPGTVTLQMEPLPKDVPSMTNPDPRAMHVAPLTAIRLQSDTDFALNGFASVVYTLPRQQYMGRAFAIQLYSEGVLRGKRTDQFLATYTKFTTTDPSSISFSFPTPKISVKRGQIWLLALYGLTYPPNTTPSPSPSPSSPASVAPSASPSASASP